MGVTASNLAGAELKAHRMRAGLKQIDIAETLGYALDTIKSVETGRRPMSIDLAIAADRYFRTPGTPEEPVSDEDVRGTFVRAFEAARAQSLPDWFIPAVQFEIRAARITEWELRGVPGLLQVASYAWAVIRAGMPYASAETVERNVTSRLERQVILSRDDGPKLLCIVCEGVLHQCVGPVSVMKDQLDHLLRLAESDAPVVIQVLPFRATSAPGLEGPVTLYEFRDGKSPVCYCEGFRAARVVENPSDVAGIASTLDMVKASASSPADSLALIHQIRRGFDD